MKPFWCLCLILVFVLSALGQQIEMKTIEDDWRIYPLFALDADHAAATDLKKQHIEIFYKGRSIRDFLFYRNPLHGTSSALESEQELGQSDRRMTVVFDTLYSDSQTMRQGKDLTKWLIKETADTMEFAIERIHPKSGLQHICGPFTDKDAGIAEIMERLHWPYNHRPESMNPEEKTEKFLKAVTQISATVKNIHAIPFVFIIGGPDLDSPLLSPSRWKEIPAAVFIIRLTNAAADSPTAPLSTAHRTMTVTGDDLQVRRKLRQILNAYYEIALPRWEKLSGMDARLAIRCNLPDISVWTSANLALPGARRSRSGGQDTRTDRTDTSHSRMPSLSSIQKNWEDLTDKISRGVNSLAGTAAKHYGRQLEIHLIRGRLKEAQADCRKIMRTTEENMQWASGILKELDGWEQRRRNIRLSLVEMKRTKKKLNNIPATAVGPPLPSDKEERRKSLRSLEQMLETMANHRRVVQNTWRDIGMGKGDWWQIVAEISRLGEDDNSSPAIFRNMFRDLTSVVSEIQGLNDRIKQTLRHQTAVEDPARVDMILRYNQQFPVEFKKKFYEAKLKTLGLDPVPDAEAGFFKTVIHATGLSLNPAGGLEGTFHNGTVMVYVPGGPFTMGVPYESGAQDESPAHQIQVSGYWISKYETTFHQFDLFCTDTDRQKPHDNGFGRRQRPVINVAWKDARAYCRWLGADTGLRYRLPRECEWEKAARGDLKTQYPWGNGKPDGEKANFADINLLYKYEKNNPPTSKEEHTANLSWMNRDVDDDYVYTAPVGKYPAGASPYGVLDMAGNVWEMMGDWYDGEYYQNSPSQDPGGPGLGAYKVTRGGGWDSHPWMLRSTGRAGGNPKKSSDSLGFRVVMTHEID